jgi:hypothetical protein
MMKLVYRFFLSAKHWQIFLLIFGAYCVGQFQAMFSVAAPHSPNQIGGFGILFWFAMALFGFSFVAWFWSMGSFLGSIVRPELKLKPALFHFALIYPVFYAFFFFEYVLTPKTSSGSLIVPLHLLAIFCVLYIMYFDSKSLALVEREVPLSFSDWAVPFFLLWFFPFGVWIIQPKINRLYIENLRRA